MTNAEKLVELETALHSLLTGKRVVTVGYGEERLTFTDGSIAELRIEIAKLKAEIAGADAPTRRPLGMWG